MLGKIAGILGGDVAKAAIDGAGRAANNLLDRFIPKKMSEAEKWQKAKDVMDHDIEQGQLEVKDVNKAREMWMTFLRTQKVPWLARFLNAIYRPFCGFMAVFYLTDKFWAQVVGQFVKTFQWTPIERDPVVDGLVAVIVYFFFGYRQRSKEKNVAGVG